MTQYFTFNEPTEKDFARPDFRDWFTRVLKDVAAKNETQEAEARQAFSTMMAQATALYGASSNVVRYLRKQGVPTPSSNTRKANAVWERYRKYLEAQERARRKAARDVEKERQRVLDAQRAQEAKADRERKYQEYRLRQDAAVAALEQRGFALGVDFERGNAITFLRRLEDEDAAKAEQLAHEYRSYDA